MDLQRREVPWEKVPFVPRPSLIADPVTAFGKKKPKIEERKSILDTINRAAIKPDPAVLNRPLKPYTSAREVTRNKVLDEVNRMARIRENGGSQAIATDKNSMDCLLARVHKNVPTKENHRRVFFVSDPTYLTYKRI